MPKLTSNKYFFCKYGIFYINSTNYWYEIYSILTQPFGLFLFSVNLIFFLTRMHFIQHHLSILILRDILVFKQIYQYLYYSLIKIPSYCLEVWLDIYQSLIFHLIILTSFFCWHFIRGFYIWRDIIPTNIWVPRLHKVILNLKTLNCSWMWVPKP